MKPNRDRSLRAKRAALTLALAVTALTGAGAAGAVEWAPADLHSRLTAHLPDLAPPGNTFTNGDAYLQSLAPRVLAPASAPTNAAAPSLLRSNVYAAQVGYLRVAQVDDSLPGQITAVTGAWSVDRSIEGLVLDLRAASGTNFASALRTARLFGEIPARDIKLGTVPLLTEDPPAPAAAIPPVPLAILVNRQTRGAAELLAAALRRATTAPAVLLIGTNTAGEARTYRPVTLGEGLELRIAADAVVLPGGEPFPLEGLKPDLAVHVAPDDEALYLADEYQRVIRGRRVAIDTSARLNEAELVRRRRGLRPSGGTPSEPPTRAVQDPALSRALDLLETLADERRTPSVPDGNSR